MKPAPAINEKLTAEGRCKTVTLTSHSNLGKLKLFMTPIRKGYGTQYHSCAPGTQQLADFRDAPAQSEPDNYNAATPRS